jgi:hypothetical protein
VQKRLVPSSEFPTQELTPVCDKSMLLLLLRTSFLPRPPPETGHFHSPFTDKVN